MKAVADLGFPVGGRGLLRRLRFENFVCQNERILTLGGGGRAPGTPPLDPPMDGTQEIESMPRIRSQFIMRNGLLFRKYTSTSKGHPLLEFVRPKQFRDKVLKVCYDNVRHMGIDRCTSLIRD